MAEGVGFPFPSLPLNEGRTYGQPEVVLISLPKVATGLRFACPARSVGGAVSRTTSWRPACAAGRTLRGAHRADLLMPQGALLRRGRSDSSTPAKSEEDAVGNQCRIRQKGGIVLWLYFILQ